VNVSFALCFAVSSSGKRRNDEGTLAGECNISDHFSGTGNATVQRVYVFVR